MIACNIACGDIDYTLFYDPADEEEVRYCCVCASEIYLGGDTEIECSGK